MAVPASLTASSQSATAMNRERGNAAGKCLKFSPGGSECGVVDRGRCFTENRLCYPRYPNMDPNNIYIQYAIAVPRKH